MKLTKLSLERNTFAFLNINRNVDNHLKKSLCEIKAILAPILVTKASVLEGNFELINAADGSTITTDYDNIYVVLDGQHRVKTALNLLREAENYCDSEEKMNKKGQPKVKKDLTAITEVFANVVEKEDLNGLTVGGYIRELNSTSKNWNGSDYIKSMCETKEQDVVTKTYNAFEELGMSITSISLYLTGKKCTNREKIVKHLDNKTDLGITDEECYRAIKMYIAMRRIGFTKKFLASRYMPCVLHGYISSDVLEVRMRYLGNLTKDDVSMLENHAKNSNDTDFAREVTKKSNLAYQQADVKYELLWEDITDEDVQDFLDGGYEAYIIGVVPRYKHDVKKDKANSANENNNSEEPVLNDIVKKMKLNPQGHVRISPQQAPSGTVDTKRAG